MSTQYIAGDARNGQNKVQKGTVEQVYNTASPEDRKAEILNLAFPNYKNLSKEEQQILGSMSPEELTMSPEDISNRLRTASAPLTWDNPFTSKSYSDDITAEYINAGIGDSVYDEEIQGMYQMPFVDDIRALEQSPAMKLVNGVGKAGVLFGTTLVEGLPNLLLAGTKMVTNALDDDPNTGLTDAIWDNELMKSMEAIKNWAEEVMPNYRTTEEKNNKWWENLDTANFWGDSFIKNLGFAAGALASGSWVSAGLRGISAAFRAGKFIKAAQKMGKTLSRAAATEAALATPSLATDVATTLIGGLAASAGEASIEAISAADEWFNTTKNSLDTDYNNTKKNILYSNIPDNEKEIALQELDEDYNATLAELARRRKSVGNHVFGYQMPILTLSNISTFGKLFRNGARETARNAVKHLRNTKNTAKEIAEDADDIVNYITSKGLTMGNVAAKTLKTGIVEGNEEMMQLVTTTAASNQGTDNIWKYYKALRDNEAMKETMTNVQSIYEAIKTVYGDPEKYEEGFVGFLTGIMGIPAFRSASTTDAAGNTKRRSPIYLAGGLSDAFAEYRNDQKQNSKIAELLNNSLNSGKWKHLYKGLAADKVFQKDMEDLAVEGKMKEFKDVEHAQYVAAISAFYQANKLGDLQAIVNQSINIDKLKNDPAELLALLDANKEQNSDGTYTYPLGIGTRTEPIKEITDLTEEERANAIDKLKRNKEQYLKEINNYAAIMGDINERYPTMSNEQVEQLAWMQSQAGNWRERSKDLIQSITMPVLLDFITNKAEKESLAAEVSLQNNHKENAKKHQEIAEYFKTLHDALIEAHSNLNNEKERGIFNDEYDSLDYALTLLGGSGMNAYFKEILKEAKERHFGTDLEQHANARMLKRIEETSDLIKIARSYNRYRSKYIEFINNPKKFQEELAQAKQEIENANSEKVLSKYKSRLKKEKTLQGMLSTYEEFKKGNAQNAAEIELLDKALQELITEDNKIAKDLNRIVGGYNTMIRKLETLPWADQKSYLDSVLKSKFENSETAEDFFKPIEADNTTFAGDQLQAIHWFNQALNDVSKGTSTPPLVRSSVSPLYTTETVTTGSDNTVKGGPQTLNPINTGDIVTRTIVTPVVEKQNTENNEEGNDYYRNGINQIRVKRDSKGQYSLDPTEHSDSFKEAHSMIEWDYLPNVPKDAKIRLKVYKKNPNKKDSGKSSYDLIDKDGKWAIVFYVYKDENGTDHVIGALPQDKKDAGLKALWGKILSEIKRQKSIWDSNEYLPLDLNLEAPIVGKSKGRILRGKEEFSVSKGHLPEGAFIAVKKGGGWITSIKNKDKNISNEIKVIPGTICVCVPRPKDNENSEEIFDPIILNTRDSSYFTLKDPNNNDKETPIVDAEIYDETNENKSNEDESKKSKSSEVYNEIYARAVKESFIDLGDIMQELISIAMVDIKAHEEKVNEKKDPRIKFEASEKLTTLQVTLLNYLTGRLVENKELFPVSFPISNIWVNAKSKLNKETEKYECYPELSIVFNTNPTAPYDSDKKTLSINLAKLNDTIIRNESKDFYIPKEFKKDTTIRKNLETKEKYKKQYRLGSSLWSSLKKKLQTYKGLENNNSYLPFPLYSKAFINTTDMFVTVIDEDNKPIKYLKEEEDGSDSLFETFAFKNGFIVSNVENSFERVNANEPIISKYNPTTQNFETESSFNPEIEFENNFTKPYFIKVGDKSREIIRVDNKYMIRGDNNRPRLMNTVELLSYISQVKAATKGDRYNIIKDLINHGYKKNLHNVRVTEVDDSSKNGKRESYLVINFINQNENDIIEIGRLVYNESFKVYKAHISRINNPKSETRKGVTKSAIDKNDLIAILSNLGYGTLADQVANGINSNELNKLIENLSEYGGLYISDFEAQENNRYSVEQETDEFSAGQENDKYYRQEDIDEIEGQKNNTYSSQGTVRRSGRYNPELLGDLSADDYKHLQDDQDNDDEDVPFSSATKDDLFTDIDDLNFNSPAIFNRSNNNTNFSGDLISPNNIVDIQPGNTTPDNISEQSDEQIVKEKDEDNEIDSESMGESEGEENVDEAERDTEGYTDDTSETEDEDESEEEKVTRKTTERAVEDSTKGDLGKLKNIIEDTQKISNDEVKDVFNDPSESDVVENYQDEYSKESQDEFPEESQNESPEISEPELITQRPKPVDYIDLHKEIEWLGRVLPQLTYDDRVQIVHGLIKKMHEKGLAFGYYSKGFITISDIAAATTIFHEAFHAVFDLYLSQKEREQLLQEAYDRMPEERRKLVQEYKDAENNKKANMECEEWLAESFAEFVKEHQDTVIPKQNWIQKLGKRICKFFSDILGISRLMKENELLIPLIFSRINSGHYAKRVKDNTAKRTLKQRAELNSMTNYANLSKTDKAKISLKLRMTKEAWNKLHPLERLRLLEC